MAPLTLPLQENMMKPPLALAAAFLVATLIGVATYVVLVGGLVPKGTIVAWDGSVELPRGWKVCDGTQGTPDLRNRFLRGVGANENPSFPSGSVTNSIDPSTSLPLKNNRKIADPNEDAAHFTHTHPLPAHAKVIFIIKIGIL